MKYVVLIQARCGSSRLPNKVLKKICGKPLLQWIIERIQKSKLIDEVMVITSIDKSNLPILKLCAENNIRVGVGSENDVLDRYYQTAKLLRPDYVIRVTGDCPCIDHGLLDLAIKQMEKNVDYCATTLNETLADGLDMEIIKFEALEQAWKEAEYTFEREHVTQYIIHHPELFFHQSFVSPIGDFSSHRWTVDEMEDFEVITKIYEYFIYEKNNVDFNYQDILKFLDIHPEIKLINHKYERNEGLKKSLKEDGIFQKQGNIGGIHNG